MMPAIALPTAHPWIEQWQPAGGADACWVAVPSSAGARGFRKQGWRGFHAQIADWAAAQGLDPGALRVVSALPPAGVLQPLPLEPQLLAAHAVGERGLQLLLRVPFELAIFQGHFPTVPIVPGAVLTGWAARLAARHAGWPHGALAVQAVKFRRIVQPGRDVALELRWEAALGRLDFRYHEGAQLNAQGSLLALPP